MSVRVQGETRFRRGSPASYRGRAMNAWAAGADGLHLFNFFVPKAPLWREIGDPGTLATLDKLYFVSVRDGDPRSYLAGGRQYRTVPIFGPSQPRMITGREPVKVDIVIGDDLAAGQRRGYRPSVTLHVEMPTVPKAEQLHVRLNGSELAGGELQDGWGAYPVPPACVKRGVNEVQICADPG